MFGTKFMASNGFTVPYRPKMFVSKNGWPDRWQNWLCVIHGVVVGNAARAVIVNEGEASPPRKGIAHATAKSKAKTNMLNEIQT